MPQSKHVASSLAREIGDALLCYARSDTAQSEDFDANVDLFGHEGDDTHVDITYYGKDYRITVEEV